MSSMYIIEPATDGKVLLKTSAGDLDIELWSKEAPKACRNFVQLCMEGYYDETIFHRLVKGFIVQGGDPTGSGFGGESIYDKPFKDEIHSRLKFGRRGIVGMANSGQKNDNGSQFFMTLDQASELNGKHTVFGKVTGSTIFNIVTLGETETDSNDRPLYPHKIIKAIILSNPFSDIVPRVDPAQSKNKMKDDKKKISSRSKATKNFSLLSFGDEAEVDEENEISASENLKKKSKSSHDLLEDRRLSNVPVVKKEELIAEPEEEEDEKIESLDILRSKLKRKHKEVESIKEELGGDSLSESEEEKEKLKRLNKLKKESRALKKELSKKQEIKLETKDEKGDKACGDNEKCPADDVISQYIQQKMEYTQRKNDKLIQLKNKSIREKDTQSLLDKFMQRIECTQKMKGLLGNLAEEEEEEEELDQEACWMSDHTLDFGASANKVLDANVADGDRYELYDPRNPLNKRRRDEKHKKHKRK